MYFQRSTSGRKRTVRTPVRTDRSRHHSIHRTSAQTYWRRTRRMDGRAYNQNFRTDRMDRKQLRHKDRKPVRTADKQSARRASNQSVRRDHIRHHTHASPQTDWQRIRRTDGMACGSQNCRTDHMDHRQPLHRDRKSARRAYKRWARTVDKQPARRGYSHSKLRKGVQRCRHRQSL